MKVACIGNMNNMLFVLCRYLRDAGIDCDLLLLNNEFEHFSPSNDSLDNSYLSFTKQLKWGDIKSFDKTTPEEIKHDLKNYGFIIATQTPAFFKRSGIVIDVFFPAGADLFYHPFILDSMNWVSRFRQKYLVKYLKAHRQAIKEALIVNQEPFSEPYKGAIKKLEIENIYYFGCPLVYKKLYDSNDFQLYSSVYQAKFLKIRQEHDVMIFNQARQLWAKNNQGNHPSKGSDNLINGFADFISENKKVTGVLVLLEYGEDVEESKALIKERGIENYVAWMPKMARKDLMYGLQLSDFGCGEFDPGCIGGLTAWESLAVGTCLLHYMDETKVRFDEFTGIYPFVNVRHPEEIAAVFADFVNEPEKYQEIGQDGAQWYTQNFGVNCVNKWIELIKLKENEGAEGLRKFMKQRSVSLSSQALEVSNY